MQSINCHFGDVSALQGHNPTLLVVLDMFFLHACFSKDGKNRHVLQKEDNLL